MTLKFDRRPSKTIGHLFSATWSFVQHFVAIGEFKLELQSGNNAQSRSNSTILEASDLEIEYLFYATSSFVQHFVAIGEFKLEFLSGNAQSRSKSTISLPCDLEIWRMTFKSIRTPLLSIIKQYASFHQLMCIQTGFTVRKRLIWVKFDDFQSHVTLKFDGWPWKTIGHLFHATSSFVQHFVAIAEFKLESQSGNAQSGSNSTIFRAVWPWNLTDELEKQ